MRALPAARTEAARAGQGRPHLDVLPLMLLERLLVAKVLLAGLAVQRPGLGLFFDHLLEMGARRGVAGRARTRFGPGRSSAGAPAPCSTPLPSSLPRALPPLR